MLMNFSPITISMPQSYISQDETDILLEIDRTDGIKHRFTEYERRCFPRVCGGDPGWHGTDNLRGGFSPRMRG